MFFHSTPGIIALDIDGTVTVQPNPLAPCVIDALNRYVEKGWKIIFITGRSFQWGEATLRVLPFRYSLAIQNGAALVEMPEKTILKRKYLNQNILSKMDAISKQFQTGYAIYSGMENEDVCYYLPTSFPPALLSYGLRRATHLGEKWLPIETFDDLSISHFTSVKFFTNEKFPFKLSQAISEQTKLHAPLNRDPFHPDYFVIQATHPEATKGNILKDFIQINAISGPIIAAGDDYNDWSMLQEADIKIIMSTAPQDLLAIADVISPPADEYGIVQGLENAMQKLSKKEK